MRKKKGFTLIELLAVIAIIGLISLIAIPNIVNLSNGIRKDQMLDDAKKLISLAKYYVNTDYEIRNLSRNDICNGTYCKLYINMLNVNGDIGDDPDGGSYFPSSLVIYRLKTVNSYTSAAYCVTLLGSKRQIGELSQTIVCDNSGCSGCVEEDGLYSRSNVIDMQTN